MAIIQTGITINAAPGDVFALLSEHAWLGELGGGTSRLLKAGILHSSGTGAVRETKVGGLRFEEEVTAFEPAFSYSYQILSCTLPFTHEGGTVTVKTAAGHADVHWESTFYCYQHTQRFLAGGRKLRNLSLAPRLPRGGKEQSFRIVPCGGAPQS